MKLDCQRCRYCWDYKGKSAWYTSCPRCRTSIKVKRSPFRLKSAGGK